MARTQSLGWLFLVGVITLAIGAILILAFREFMPEIFAMDGWDDIEGAETTEVADEVSSGQRSIEAMWTVMPVLLPVAVAVSILIKARRVN